MSCGQGDCRVAGHKTAEIVLIDVLLRMWTYE